MGARVAGEVEEGVEEGEGVLYPRIDARVRVL